MYMYVYTHEYYACGIAEVCKAFGQAVEMDFLPHFQAPCTLYIACTCACTCMLALAVKILNFNECEYRKENCLFFQVLAVAAETDKFLMGPHTWKHSKDIL